MQLPFHPIMDNRYIVAKHEKLLLINQISFEANVFILDICVLLNKNTQHTGPDATWPA